AGEHPALCVHARLLPRPGARAAHLLGGPPGGERDRVALRDATLRPAAGDCRPVLLLLPLSDPAHSGFLGLVWLAEPNLHGLADPAGHSWILDCPRRATFVRRGGGTWIRPAALRRVNAAGPSKSCGHAGSRAQRMRAMS